SSTPGIVDLFNFLAAAAFNGVAGALDYFFDAIRNVTVVQGDTNGDKTADFAIDLTGNISLIYNDLLGIILPTVAIEANGNTNLSTDAQGHFDLSGGGNPTLKVNGYDVLSNQFGGWHPIGAEAVSGGYEVAWKLTGADQYLVWNTDGNGNYLSQALAVTSGANA